MGILELGKALKKRRKDLGITQPHLAELAGISKNDIGKISSLSILAKYICPIVAFWCLIIIFNLSYENSYGFSELRKAEGKFKHFKEVRVKSLLDRLIGDGWKVYQLNIYLENTPVPYTMLDNIKWYTFLYGLKAGDELEIYYLSQYDNRIKELIVNGTKKYSFELEKSVLTGKIQDNFKIILIALIIHLLWKYNHPRFLWQKDDIE
jgi:transcriptional regulator with XRE-family HTH domain